MRALALDMGGTHIGCGLVEDDRLLIETSIAVEGARDLASLLPAIERQLHKMLAITGTESQNCLGLAIGFPGIVDARDGKIHSTLKKYEDAPSLDLQRWARDAFGVELRVENDARLALMGEQFAGAARGEKDVVMMTLGTGIGTAVIMGGHLLRGVHAHAGCLGGHFCGKVRWPCLSLWKHRLRRGRSFRMVHADRGERMAWIFAEFVVETESIGFRELFAHAQAGDAVAIAVSERCLQVWSANVVSLVHAYDPAVVIVGGGVMNSGSRLLAAMQEYVNQHAWASWGKPELKAAELGNKAALLGAVPLLCEEMQRA